MIMPYNRRARDECFLFVSAIKSPHHRDSGLSRAGAPHRTARKKLYSAQKDTGAQYARP